MPFREIKRGAGKLVIRSEGYIKIPILYRHEFSKNVKILFDPEQNLLALQPSNDLGDYPITRWRIFCTQFLRTYKISSQETETVWDRKNKYLIARVKRG